MFIFLVVHFFLLARPKSRVSICPPGNPVLQKGHSEADLFLEVRCWGGKDAPDLELDTKRTFLEAVCKSKLFFYNVLKCGVKILQRCEKVMERKPVTILT